MGGASVRRRPLHTVAASVWFASSNGAKPGVNSTTYTLVSTAAFAVEEITKVPMQTPSGEFIPQDKTYLIEGPGRVLAEAFREAISQEFGVDTTVTVVFGQRW